jgi:hypothetical protein
VGRTVRLRELVQRQQQVSPKVEKEVGRSKRVIRSRTNMEMQGYIRRFLSQGYYILHHKPKERHPRGRCPLRRPMSQV